MATQAISKTPSVTPDQLASAKQADSGNGSDTQFNQVLSQQIADRRSADKAESSRAANASKAADNSKTADANKARDAKAKDADNKPAQTDKPAETTAVGKTKDDKKIDDTIAAEAANAANTANTDPPPLTATELLAAAANMQNQPGRADSGKPTTPQDAIAGAISATVVGIDQGTGSTRVNAADMIANSVAQNAAKGATAKPGSDFRTVLDQAGDSKKPQDVGAGKTQDTVAAALTADKVRDANAEMLAAAKSQETPGTAASVAVPQIQQTAFNVAQAAANMPTEKLTPNVGTQAWDQALGQKVVWMVAGGQQSASLTLNPPDLGPLQVVLHVSNGHTDASFFAAQPEVRHALEAAMPQLREMMSDAGIQLGQANVSAGTPNQQNNPGAQFQQASGGSGNNSGTDDQAAAAVRVSRTQHLADGLGLVDTFA